MDTKLRNLERQAAGGDLGAASKLISHVSKIVDKETVVEYIYTSVFSNLDVETLLRLSPLEFLQKKYKLVFSKIFATDYINRNNRAELLENKYLKADSLHKEFFSLTQVLVFIEKNWPEFSHYETLLVVYPYGNMPLREDPNFLQTCSLFGIRRETDDEFRSRLNKRKVKKLNKQRKEAEKLRKEEEKKKKAEEEEKKTLKNLLKKYPEILDE